MKEPQQNQHNFYIEGEDSLKGLCAEELLSRVISTSNPAQRAKEAIPILTEEFFRKVHIGLVKKYSIVVEQKSKL